MAVKIYKPTSPGKRGRSGHYFSEITKDKPEKSLTRSLRRKGGRNNQGRISIRHRGGGTKRRYRIIDFKRDKDRIPGYVASIEYDPNRSARIALVHYKDGEKRYIIAPKDLKVGDKVISGKEVALKNGNSLSLREIPEGSQIHNVELQPGRGAQLVRSAGTTAQLLSKERKYAQVKLPSGEVRLIPLECKATLGQVGNVEQENIQAGKAGRSRWLDRRSKVRGVAMNPIDHPHGGGEGRSGPGRHPVTPWGKPTRGAKTRRKKKFSDRLIIQRKKR